MKMFDHKLVERLLVVDRAKPVVYIALQKLVDSDLVLFRMIRSGV